MIKTPELSFEYGSCKHKKRFVGYEIGETTGTKFEKWEYDPDAPMPESCDGCEHVGKIVNRYFCFNVPPRCDLHQVIRGQIFDPDDRERCCTWCVNYKKQVDCSACIECIKDVHLAKFKRYEE